MDTSESRDNRYTKIANISAVLLLLFLGESSLFSIMGRAEVASTIVSLDLFTAASFLVLIMALRSLKNPSTLGFVVPFILSLFYTILMEITGWSSHYYFLACLCFCGISCMYSSFSAAVWYITIQNIIVAVLVFNGTPLVGPEIPFYTTLTNWAVTMFVSALLLLIVRSATVILEIAAKDQKSFRSLLTTTPNYVIMVDNSNRVIHISDPMAKMAKIGKAELATGRPFIDLFPGRELKLLAYQMLEQKRSYEADWEFMLDGQKHYFRAVSTSVAGSRSETLVTLYDMTYMAERDEIALMRDSLNIGLFFMNKDYIIQDQYSHFLEGMIGDEDLGGRSFLDLLSASFKAKELDAVRDYFDMLFTRNFDQSMLIDINPLNELNYMSDRTNKKKVLHCNFDMIERNRGELYVLVTIYDITAKIELQQRLLEEENRRQDEMKTIFELIQVESRVFNDFLADAEYEFDRINETLKKDSLSSHEALVEVYQSVHAIKSNAVILGLDTFGEKVHTLESTIKKLRELEEEVPFDDMLQLAIELDKLSLEKEVLKSTREKIQSLSQNTGDEKYSQSEYVLVESLSKTTSRAAEDIGKKVNFVVDDLDADAVENGPRRVMKEVLMQLIRNSVVHGIETPEERTADGKNEAGTIRLSIKIVDDKIHIKLKDDGRGIDFDKIREKALQQKLLREEDKDNKGLLLRAMFSPGFSTAETEGVHAGRGIGLNLVQDRVREGQGSIKVQTESGKGTSFSIFFPANQNTEPRSTGETVLAEETEN